MKKITLQYDIYYFSWPFEKHISNIFFFNYNILTAIRFRALIFEKQNITKQSNPIKLGKIHIRQLFPSTRHQAVEAYDHQLNREYVRKLTPDSLCGALRGLDAGKMEFRPSSSLGTERGAWSLGPLGQLQFSGKSWVNSRLCGGAESSLRTWSNVGLYMCRLRLWLDS